MAELCPLFSGSTGNSYYIGSKSSGILVDIGRSCKQVTTVMQRCGIDPLSVQGILITHEHSDHISGLRVFASKYHIPVFASKGTLGALESMGILNDKYPAYTIEDTLELAGMHVNAFRTPHDCAESFGYRIEAEDGHTVTVATDIGHITPEVEENLHGTDLAVIESNHDIGMLRTGPYPYSLKRRILSDFGHLSNTACADLLPDCFNFVRGVVDSQDLSLNISREMLQHNRQLTIIARNIEKKIKSELKAMLENDREKYEEFYAAFGRQLKYGTVSDYGAHKEATQDLLLFYSHKQGKLVSLKEYVDAMAEGQEKIYYAPGENKERLSKLPQVETLTKKGYDVLLFTEDVDEFVPQTLMTYMEKPFCNVSTEDLGLQTEEEKKQAEEKAEEMKGLLTFVKETLGDRVKEVKLSSELGSHPVCMTPAEGMSFEMEKYMKRANPEFAFPVGRVLELNPEHEAVQAMQKAMTEDPEKAKDYAKLLCYQAQLMAELPLDDPYAYTELVCRLMK